MNTSFFILLFTVFFVSGCMSNHEKKHSDSSYDLINKIIQDNKIQIPYVESILFTEDEVFKYLSDTLITNLLSKEEVIEMKTNARKNQLLKFENNKLAFNDTLKEKTLYSKIVSKPPPNGIKDVSICKLSQPYLNKEKTKVAFIRREIIEYTDGISAGNIYVEVYSLQQGKWVFERGYAIDMI